MLENQIPIPPLDMVMPPVYSQMLVSNFIALALVMMWVIREARRTGSAVPILIMGGALVASLTECIWDTLGAVWYPQHGHDPLYRMFNISVPLWMLAAYPCYLGGLGNYVYKRLNEGMSQSQFWKFYALAWFANFLLEIPVLQMGVYVYHGPQPFMLYGFPLWQAMGNSLMPVVIGATIYVWRDLFAGMRSLLILLVVPMAQVIALGSVGWPTMLVLNSGHGYEVTYPAAIVSFGLSLLVGYMISSKVCRSVPDRIGEPALRSAT
jgi:hypothetical protein